MIPSYSWTVPVPSSSARFLSLASLTCGLLLRAEIQRQSREGIDLTRGLPERRHHDAAEHHEEEEEAHQRKGQERAVRQLREEFALHRTAPFVSVAPVTSRERLGSRSEIRSTFGTGFSGALPRRCRYAITATS